ncbi:hypothetical protein AYK25_09905 [Thermoplasmatales archaeon SM1-50]|nr:MAG: hypothetical protein AYK25_09905 [Thermoplasmatales archaeon SM1-50]
MTYFWKKNGSIYHWHLHCKAVPVYVRTNPNWEISEELPNDKQRCKECREMDIIQRIKKKT